MDEEINGILLENEQGKHGFTPSLSLTNPFVRYMQAIRKSFCLLILLPCAFQVFVYLSGESTMLFMQGSNAMADRNGIGVFAQYYDVYDLVDFIFLRKIIVVFIIASILIVAKRFFACDYFGTCLALTPFVVFLFTSLVLHKFDDDLFRELSLINFKANECRFMDRLGKVSGQYDEECCKPIYNNRGNLYAYSLNAFTCIEQQFGQKEDFSAKGKLIVWSFGNVHGDIHLLVYDESDEVANPKTKQRYIGRFCVGSITYNCSLTDDYGNLVYGGYPPRNVMKLKSHFYIVLISDPMAGAYEFP